MTVLAFIGFILLILHLIEPQCSNTTDSEVHLTVNSRQCMEELEYYPSDCNNSSAMTSELPLSDESKQWIAQDTCSGRDSADTCYMHWTDAHRQLAAMLRQYASSDAIKKMCNELNSDYITNDAVNLISNYSMLKDVRCSTAPTPTTEPQASATPTDTPTVKGMDI